MKPINKIMVAIIGIVIICIAVSYYNVLKHYKLQQVTYDLPEEFNPQTISHDRSDATQGQYSSGSHNPYNDRLVMSQQTSFLHQIGT